MSDGTASKALPPGAPAPMCIPETIADAPTQRFYVSSIFILIQALKFYDYIQLYGAPPASETFFAVKWVVIDGAFLFLLPKLRIPWLSFSLAASLSQIVFISVLNICLSARIPFSISAISAALIRLFYDRELSVLENNVKVADIIHNRTRILGQHTINILPESTARLNPINSCFCVSGNLKDISIPIRMNSTIPMLIQYSRTSPDDNSVTQHNITGKQLKQLLKHTDSLKRNVWDFHLPISDPGLYRLERVQDSSRLDVRILRSQALVVNCPTATLAIPERLEHHPDRCTGDLDELSIRVSGLPPLRVKYNRWIEGRERVSTIDSVQPVKYFSPLMSGHHEDKSEDGASLIHNLAGIKDMVWARTHEIDVHLNSSLQQPGKWSFSIDEVEDACGNIVNFAAGTSKSERVLAKSKPTSDALSDRNEITETPNYAFMVHERPTIAFRGCTPENPTKLLADKDAILGFDIGSTEHGPFEVLLTRGEGDSVVPFRSEEIEIFRNLTLDSRTQRTAVDQPGIYNIQAFSSRFCKGVIQMPSSCLVFRPPRPSLSVSFDSIYDKCAGSIGLAADLSFTGTAPFDITWKEVKDGKAMLHRKKIDRARHQLRFTPEEAGEFHYEFVGLDDLNYKGNKLQSQAYQTRQIVYPLAGASFIEKGPKKCCIGDEVEFSLRLVGTGPWDLTYEILHNGKRSKYELHKIKTAQHIIRTPHLKSGGTHVISLIDIQDANGCRTPLEAADAIIEVRRDRPSASFYTIDDKFSATIIEEADISLPLRLLGDSPWTVTLQAPDGEKTLTFRDANGKLNVKATGKYTLLDVKDSFCPGNVDTRSDKFEIEHFSRPHISLPSLSADGAATTDHTRDEVCEGDDDAFDIEIYGAAPFAVSYERSFFGLSGDEERQKKSLELNAALPVASIKSKTTPAGLYRYKFLGVSDARYDAKPDKIKAFTIQQFVNPRPKALFLEPEKVYNYCLEVDLVDQETEGIPIEFSGQAPFKAVFRIKHQITGITEFLTEVNIETSNWSLQIPKNMLTLGNHAISIAEVQDAKGCSQVFSERDSHIYIAISEMPSIFSVSSRREFCVGDRISYSLQGSPPFKVEYEFEKVKRRATINGPVFTRIAEQPGEFSILAVSDSASKCKVAVNGLEKIIYDIPSVRVSEGKTIIESIHEGDKAEIIFHFYGTPPFSLTYTRSEASKGRGTKVLETHSVSGIWEDSYVVQSSVAGTFAATEVHDAHCRVSLQK